MRRSWWWLVLVLVPGLIFGPILGRGETTGPHDQIRAMAPWNGPEPKEPWDVLQADGVLQSAVWRKLVLESWSRHEVPMINDRVLLSTPLLANSQSGGFYVPHILLGLLGGGWAVAGVLLAWFHLAIAGTGVRALVRALGGSEGGAIFAGLSFQLSAFLLAWTALSSVPATVSWIPWALAGTALAAKSRLPVVGLAAAIGMMITAGHLQFAAYGFIGVMTLAVAVVRPWPRTGLVAAGLALGVGLAAVQLLPVLAFSGRSHRRTVATAEGATAYLGSAIRPFEFASLAMPTALGDPRDPGPEAVPGKRISTYWPPLVKPGANFAEGAVALGAAVLVLLAFVPWRSAGARGVAAVGGVGLLLATGPLSLLLYHLVPGWASTGSPGRAIVLFVLAGCVLAGLAEPSDDRRQRFAAIGLGVAGLLAAAVLPGLATAEGPAVALRGAATATTLPALLGVLTPVFLTLFLVNVQRGLWPILGAVAAISGLVQARLVTRGVPLEPAEVPRDRRIAVVNDNWNLLVRPDAILPPNTVALSGGVEVGGYDSLLDAGTKGLLDEANGQDSAPPANGNMMFVKPGVDLAALGSLGVTEVWSRRPISPDSFDKGSVFVTRTGVDPLKLPVNGRPGKASFSAAKNTPRVGPLRRNLPGWDAGPGGSPPPESEPTYNPGWMSGRGAPRYVAPGYETGRTVSLLSVLALLAFCLTARKRRSESES